MTERRQGGLPTNLRTLVILEEVARLGASVTPTAVNQTLGLPKPTIHRLFATLEAEGFLIREMDGRSYAPGRRMRSMATGTLSSARARTARLAVLSGLAEEVGETCNIAAPDGDAMIYLDRVETKWPLRIQLPIGTRVPFHCTASGKMHLSTLSDAHLERYLRAARLTPHGPATLTEPEALRRALAETRARGYSEDAEEFMEGMIAIAVPIADEQRRLASTLSFHAPAMRLPLAEARRHLPRLREAAAELARLVAAPEETAG